jgi:hypothetical protein
LLRSCSLGISGTFLEVVQAGAEVGERLLNRRQGAQLVLDRVGVGMTTREWPGWYGLVLLEGRGCPVGTCWGGARA